MMKLFIHRIYRRCYDLPFATVNQSSTKGTCDLRAVFAATSQATECPRSRS